MVQDIEQFGMWHLVPGCQSVDGQQTLAPADPGEGPGGPPPLYLDQTKARRAEKNFFFLRPPPLPQGEGLDDTPPSPLPLPPNLKVWIRHCISISIINAELCKSCPRGREVGGDTTPNYLGVSVRSHQN